MAACGSRPSSDGEASSRLASFTVAEYVPPAGNPSWNVFRIKLERLDNPLTVKRDIPREGYSKGSFQDITMRIEEGRYHILLSYYNDQNVLLYESCKTNPNEVDKDHILVRKETYKVKISVCKAQTGEPAGQAETKDLGASD